MATVADFLQRHSELLPASDTALLDTELLLCHCLSVNRTWLKTWPDKTLSLADAERFDQLFQRRLEGEPVAFIIGTQGFWSLDLSVSPHTLIPRPETELLVETALELDLPGHSQVLDLGSGTGAIALALASEYPHWQLIAVDVQAQAVELAEQNRLAHQLDNVTIYQSNWFAGVANRQPQTKFNLIVSNPPYIEIDDAHLFEGDVRFEPASALVSGTEGLDDLKLVIGQSCGFLAAAGWLLVEHGHRQGPAVRDLFNEAGFVLVETRRDYNQLERITLGRLQD
ncbi:peptide chain release factor N(5)-glutamine methyltransferase [Porticoccaceae bacterium]|nr:peptide chain release factor N(5)-glutamine methyltransferase [Porticoccaceae bacterium]